MAGVFAHLGEIRIEAPAPNSHANGLYLPWIGIFGDSAATTCILSAQGRGRTWVYAIVGGLGYCVLGGASLRIRGFPAEWDVSASPNPKANLLINDLLGTGARLTFPDCVATERKVLLYTIDYFARGDVPYTAWITGLYPPPWPTVTLCDATGRIEQPVIAAHGYFDPSASVHCGVVAVNSTPWSRVKQMFR